MNQKQKRNSTEFNGIQRNSTKTGVKNVPKQKVNNGSFVVCVDLTSFSGTPHKNPQESR
jgi:hypothetical protein